MTMIGEDLAAAFARFPLLKRPRPAGLPLKMRVRELRELAAQSNGDQIVAAAEILNKAALIASDCGLPDLARALCWRQYDVFDQARPLPAAMAKLALQPLLNLPRQLIREGDGEGAHTILEELYNAVGNRTKATIAGRSVDLTNLVSTHEDHRRVRQQVWAALLADGTRALALAGRWGQAAKNAASHRGIGERLLDGRQIAIVALAHDGKPGQASALIEHSTIVEPWEHAVQSLLHVLCQRAGNNDAGQHIPKMVITIRSLLEQRDASTATFHTRVGMTALDLALDSDAPGLSPLSAMLIATASTDAYAARDVLAHPPLRASMTAPEHRGLIDLLDVSGLGAGTMPEPLYDKLMTAVSTAEERLRTLLHQEIRPRPAE